MSWPFSSLIGTGTISPGKKPSSVLGRGALVRLQRERVHLLARDPPLVGEHLRDPELDAERVVGVREEVGTERSDAAAGVRRHRRARHRLDAARDPDVVRAGDHALRDEVRRLLRRAALPVDARRRDAPRQSGRDPGVAGDVAALLARLGDAAADDVVDQRGIEVVAVDHRAQHETEQIGGVPAGERTLALPESGARAVDDDGFTCHNLTR